MSYYLCSLTSLPHLIKLAYVSLIASIKNNIKNKKNTLEYKMKEERNYNVCGMEIDNSVKPNRTG